MARILMVYFSDYGEAMYDAITDVLRENGNDIFRFNINNPKVKNTRWGGMSKIVDEELFKSIKIFNPEIVLNFNNAMPKNCHEILSDECKICVIDADCPNAAFWNRDAYYQNRNKYLYIGLQSYSKQMYEDFLCIKLDEGKNYLYMPPATVIKNENLVQDKNISFIGSNFWSFEAPKEDSFYSEEAIKIYNEVRKNYYVTAEEIEKLGISIYNIDLLLNKIKYYYAGQERLKYMEQLVDLGFKYYGLRFWKQIAYYDLELAKCFDSTPITTIQENQWVYNTSKLSVNLSHPLAKTSFSWRVMDIMASNSCLLTEDKPDWRDLFERYLSQETLDVIIYKDRFDMREKAIKLLNDDSLRKKCVKELNYAIEKNGRWELRFSELEKFLGINLLNLKNKNTEYIYIPREEIVKDATKENLRLLDSSFKIIEKKLDLMNKINTKLSLISESERYDYALGNMNEDTLDTIIKTRYYAIKELKSFKEDVKYAVHKNYKMNIAHAYAQNYNFGDNALAYGVKNIFSKYYEHDVNFEDIDVHSTDFDKFKVDELNENYNLFLVGGGGLIHSDQGKHWLFNITNKEASGIKVPMIFYALGFNNETENGLHPDIIKNIKYLKSKAVSFTVRNDGSKERLKNLTLDLPEIPDPGFFVDGNHPRPDINGRYVIFQIANNSAADRQTDKIFIDKAIRICKNLIQRGYTVVLAPHCNIDTLVCNEVLSKISSDKLRCWDWYRMIRKDNVIEGLGYYKYAEFVIAMRGHSQICPMGMNIPVISLISHPKHEGLLKKLNLEKYSVYLKDVHWDEKIELLIDEVENNYDIIKKNLSEIVNRLTLETECFVKGLNND